MSSADEPDAFEAASLSARAMAARPAPYLDGLNPAQRAAVEALDGPVLMLAGAGTGKTRALTARIAHLLRTGRARPNEILAVTFTNKAAREMKERVGRPDGRGRRGHALARHLPLALRSKILRRHAELVGLKSNFTILDTDDQLRLLKQLIAGREHRREALAAAAARRADRRLEEPRADARPGAGVRGGAFNNIGAASSTPPIRSGCGR